jgi:1-deoxy-D-xylulose-5-phosphate reductoisomerase
MLTKLYKQQIDFIISGISGYDSLSINFNLTKIAKNLLIANKETIICGGEIFLNYAKKNKCNILPIDSEHYCIKFLYDFIDNKDDIDKIFITASGGPFFNKKINFNEKITNVIKHPIWTMGKKISVDSSTFANKVLEVFEAKVLFNLPPNKIRIIIDQKSLVHSVIKLKNNLYLPVIHKPSMELPISNSLNVKNGINLKINNLSIKLHKPNYKKFPLIRLGFKILQKYDQTGMIFFTVINERLVSMFLNKKLSYGNISLSLLKIFRRKEVKKICKTKIFKLQDVLKMINISKNYKI